MAVFVYWLYTCIFILLIYGYKFFIKKKRWKPIPFCATFVTMVYRHKPFILKKEILVLYFTFETTDYRRKPFALRRRCKLCGSKALLFTGVNRSFQTVVVIVRNKDFLCESKVFFGNAAIGIIVVGVKSLKINYNPMIFWNAFLNHFPFTYHVQFNV